MATTPEMTQAAEAGRRKGKGTSKQVVEARSVTEGCVHRGKDSGGTKNESWSMGRLRKPELNKRECRGRTAEAWMGEVRCAAKEGWPRQDLRKALLGEARPRNGRWRRERERKVSVEVLGNQMLTRGGRSAKGVLDGRERCAATEGDGGEGGSPKCQVLFEGSECQYRVRTVLATGTGAGWLQVDGRMEECENSA
jgi:hypothetical protein